MYVHISLKEPAKQASFASALATAIHLPAICVSEQNVSMWWRKMKKGNLQFMSLGFAVEAQQLICQRACFACKLFDSILDSNYLHIIHMYQKRGQ